MKTYQSIKTQQKAGLVEQTETGVTLITEAGETKQFSASTFGRWWREVPGVEFTAPDVAVPAPEAAQPAEPEQPAAPAEPAAPEAPKAPKEKKQRGRTKVAGDHPLRAVIEDYATKQGHTIFQGKITGFRSVKVDGHMYMAFNFNTRSVTLQLRSKAIQGICEYKTLNHMFDARVTLTDSTPETQQLVKKLMDASLAYQLNKPSRKKVTADEAQNS